MKMSDAAPEAVRMPPPKIFTGDAAFTHDAFVAKLSP
jgi:hypothetical protein